MCKQQQQPHKPLVIGVIIYEGVMQLDFIGPTAYLEVLQLLGVPVTFHTISHVQGDTNSRSLNPAGFMPLFASKGYQDAPTRFDILLIPGAKHCYDLAKDPGFKEYIRTAAEQSTHVLTVCTGSGILAQTGLLDGKNATTNKVEYDVIERSYPSVKWIRKARWVVDGKIWTSSGVAAGMDMAHAFIAHQYGKDAADTLARIMETVPNTDPSNDPFAQ
ncbi:Thij/pfpi family protein, partial [Globisporangium splendens]